jgi:AraC-type DNA-binding domain-containing proteins
MTIPKKLAHEYNTGMGHQRSDFEASYRLDSRSTWSHMILHNHNFYEIFIHIRGGSSFCINDQFYTLEPGALLIIPPFTMHGMISEEPLINYERAFLYITPQMLKKIGMDEIDFLKILDSQTSNGNYKFLMPESDWRKARGLIKGMMAHMEERALLSRMADIADALSFLAIICRVVRNPESLGKPSKGHGMTQQVLAYLHENYTKTLFLSDIAAHFNVSVSYLSHEFKRNTHLSIYGYITQRRINYAKELMSSNHALTDIAFMCGFGNYSNFARVFDNLCGVSPREYRKSLQAL